MVESCDLFLGDPRKIRFCCCRELTDSVSDDRQIVFVCRLVLRESKQDRSALETSVTKLRYILINAVTGKVNSGP